MDKVKKVYSFEPFKKTYERALKNIELNGKSTKIYTYNIGLSDHNEIKNIEYNEFKIEIIVFNKWSYGKFIADKIDDQYWQNWKKNKII